MKLSYADQLRHPKWQQKRLEVLSACGWKCVGCGAEGDTLHVHHKHYVKGRMAWEYQVSELTSLCAKCHDMAHQRRAMLLEVLAQVEPINQDGGIGEGSATLLVLGFLAQDILDSDLFDRFGSGGQSRSCNAGHLARQAVDGGLLIGEISELSSLLSDAQGIAKIRGVLAEFRRAVDADADSSCGWVKP